MPRVPDQEITQGGIGLLLEGLGDAAQLFPAFRVVCPAAQLRGPEPPPLRIDRGGLVEQCVQGVPPHGPALIHGQPQEGLYHPRLGPLGISKAGQGRGDAEPYRLRRVVLVAEYQIEGPAAAVVAEPGDHPAEDPRIGLIGHFRHEHPDGLLGQGPSALVIVRTQLAQDPRSQLPFHVPVAGQQLGRAGEDLPGRTPGQGDQEGHRPPLVVIGVRIRVRCDLEQRCREEFIRGQANSGVIHATCAAPALATAATSGPARRGCRYSRTVRCG
ncbi:hypothetical protein GA0115253_1013220 [Streptomyces sp. Termitarium-T10T-6]|nr:hypothetical protein [Streptomyces sp. Termitarium-T10T-6]SCD65945.1 hypothetical protein GA0115253_1013220 [Streptomyces sp. Termitarium-T10T-6]